MQFLTLLVIQLQQRRNLNNIYDIELPIYIIIYSLCITEKLKGEINNIILHKITSVFLQIDTLIFGK